MKTYSVEIIRLVKTYESTTVEIEAASAKDAKAKAKALDLDNATWEPGETEYGSYNYDVEVKE